MHAINCVPLLARVDRSEHGKNKERTCLLYGRSVVVALEQYYIYRVMCNNVGT